MIFIYFLIKIMSLIIWESDILLRKNIVETKIIKYISKEYVQHDDKNNITYWEIEFNQETFIIYKYITDKNKVRYYLNDNDNYYDLIEFKRQLETNNIKITNNKIHFTEKKCKNKIDMAKLFEQLSSAEYSENTFDSKRHEEKVEEIFRSFGLQELDKSDTNKQKMLCGYIKQPNGSQNQPDFRVINGSNQIDIECKSCKHGYKPMWNASYPSKRTVYLYTNKKENNTLLFLGNAIINSEIEKIYREYKIKLKALEKEINDKLLNLNDKNPFGMTVYARNMYVQTKHLNSNTKETLKQKVIEEYQ